MTDQRADSAEQRRHGRCLCGAVRFSAVPKKPETAVCHCEMCRRWAAGPYFAVECCDDVVFEPSDELTFYRSSDWAERGFCRKCGTSLMWRLAQGGGYHISLPAFDDIDEVTFTTEIFIDRKPDYFDFANETQKLTEAELFALISGGQDG